LGSLLSDFAAAMANNTNKVIVKFFKNFMG
jgi:hypothetical protein